MRFPKAARDVSFPAVGVVTVFVGGDVWAGGTNKSPFGLGAMLRAATLTVDGKAVVKAGELVKRSDAILARCLVGWLPGGEMAGSVAGSARVGIRDPPNLRMASSAKVRTAGAN